MKRFGKGALQPKPKNPNLLSQDDAAIVNELYRRLDAEDPVRTALDKSMSGKISDRKP